MPLILALLFFDVIERKTAEEVLRELNTILEKRIDNGLAEGNVLTTLVETVDVFIMAVDRDCTILAIDKTNAVEFERLYGHAAGSQDLREALPLGRCCLMNAGQMRP